MFKFSTILITLTLASCGDTEVYVPQPATASSTQPDNPVTPLGVHVVATKNCYYTKTNGGSTLEYCDVTFVDGSHARLCSGCAFDSQFYSGEEPQPGDQWTYHPRHGWIRY